MSSQSNTQPGLLVFVAGEDLTGKEGYLVELRNNSGVANVNLPNANTDLTPFIVDDGGVSGDNVSVKPFEPSRNFRVPLKGSANPGDQLVLADVATAADKGKLRALPATAGTYRVIAIAEEIGVDGQLLRVRPAAVGNVTVS